MKRTYRWGRQRGEQILTHFWYMETNESPKLDELRRTKSIMQRGSTCTPHNITLLLQRMEASESPLGCALKF